MAKLFINATVTCYSGSRLEGQVFNVMKLSDVLAREKLSLLEELDAIAKTGKTVSNDLLKNYYSIVGPEQSYFISDTVFKIGQTFDKLPKDAVLSSKYFSKQ